MKLLWLILSLAICNNKIFAAPTTSEQEIEATTIDNSITINANENEVDGKLLNEENLTTNPIEIETDEKTTTDVNSTTENLKHQGGEPTEEVSSSSTLLATENPTNYSSMTQQFATNATSLAEQTNDMIKMQIIQYFREKLRAHVFRALYTVLHEMKNRQQQQMHQQHASESQIVEMRASKPLSAGSSCKCDVHASDESTVIVYDGNLRKYVRIDRGDLLPKVSSHSQHIENDAKHIDESSEEGESKARERNSVRKAKQSEVRPKSCSSCKIAGIEGLLYGY